MAGPASLRDLNRLISTGQIQVARPYDFGSDSGDEEELAQITRLMRQTVIDRAKVRARLNGASMRPSGKAADLLGPTFPFLVGQVAEASPHKRTHWEILDTEKATENSDIENTPPQKTLREQK